MLTGLHHVQVACPAGSEDALRAFYGGVLGMTEVEKPPVLAARGRCLVPVGRRGDPLRRGGRLPAGPQGAPGLLTADLDGLAAACEAAGHPVEWDPDFPGHRRLYVSDPVGNRLELLEPLSPT